MARRNRLDFRSETQEADWWAKNQEFIAERFEQPKPQANSARAPWDELPANGPVRLDHHQP